MQANLYELYNAYLVDIFAALYNQNLKMHHQSLHFTVQHQCFQR